MENTLAQKITECVEKNVVFVGLVGSAYTVQDLIHTVNLTSLNKMHKRSKKELDTLDTDSLFENSNTGKERQLQLEVDTIKEVFLYKKGLRDLEKQRAERLEKRKALLALKSDKELETFKNMSLEDINKEIEALEA